MRKFELERLSNSSDGDMRLPQMVDTKRKRNGGIGEASAQES